MGGGVGPEAFPVDLGVAGEEEGVLAVLWRSPVALRKAARW